ncbi:helix-turn-helix domain-containing protein [uncultured Nocardioides sp.]|uniref:helix-turn-helix domain-containing protein n=1 Tax=uncultured Nocardioides sp. TaxID=198441 RepID=UPI0026309305|nr:helix-turn-helix domain-containing protein [uncultured Nocardioides sp.]
MLSSTAPRTHTQAPDRRAWRDLLREHFVSLDVADAADGLHGAVESCLLGHLQLSTVTSVDQRISRSQTLISRDHDALFQVGLVRSGRAVVEQDGRTAVLEPGDFVVYETSRPFEWQLRSARSSRHWELAVLTWPRSSFRLSESHTRELTARVFAAQHGMSRVVSDLLSGLVTEQPTMAEGAATAMADQVGEILSVALEALPSTPLRPGSDRLLREVDDYIDAHLGDPGLTPDRIAQAVAISTRQLHRLFLERDLTVAQTVRTRRLEGARREIRASLTRDRSLREIARNWGFLDLAVFGRAFRAAYGLSPREYRAQQCALSGDPRARVRPRR